MTRLYRQDPTLPGPPEEQRDEQRLQEMWPEFEKLAKAERDLREAFDNFNRVAGANLDTEALDIEINDGMCPLFDQMCRELESRDPLELVEQFYQDVYRAISDPRARIKEAQDQ